METDEWGDWDDDELGDVVDELLWENENNKDKVEKARELMGMTRLLTEWAVNLADMDIFIDSKSDDDAHLMEAASKLQDVLYRLNHITQKLAEVLNDDQTS